MMDLLQNLNEQQREAVLHKDGPLMIVAGAGSGKTKVLTTRIANLMSVHGVSSFNILALTFTNKAAAEMKERIEHLLGNSEARNLYIGTFHSVFARIMRAEAHRIGFPNNFTIYDTDDSRSVIKTVVNELNLDDKQYKPNMVHNRISAAKNALVNAEDYQNDGNLQMEDSRSNRPMIGQIYRAYVARCFKNGAMDFDDLLFKFYELLMSQPEVLVKYQHKFKYVLIDEYQDTNPAQYQIIKLLSAVHENICVVGDDAQSIYSFRGATIENILQFQRDYDDVHVVKLEQNYRSTQSILNVANEVIRNNKGQIEKALWSNAEEGEKIKLVRSYTDSDEGKYVADTIQEQKLRNHYFNKDFAILYRTNAQSRSFEENLRRMGIAYRIYGGISFYQRKEVKDMVSYLRVITNTRDEEALKRIVNYPIRGIGKTSIEKLVTVANELNLSVYDVLTRAAEFGFKGGTLEAIQGFVTMIRYFQSMLAQNNAYDVAVNVGKHTGLVKELFNDKTTEGLARYENVQELLNSIKEFTELPDNEDGEVVDKGLGAYLQQITLLTDADKDDGTNSDVVKLMTIHAAKGLEFPVVFVGGMEEGLFPSMMALNTREELEEERRLFYVAITRAKQRLFLTYAQSRYRFGKLEAYDSSRFLAEMPEQYVDKTYAGGGMRNQNMGTAFDRMNGGNSWGKKKDENNTYYPSAANNKPAKPTYLAPAPTHKTVEHVPSKDFMASDTSDLQPGQKVEHQKFGFGVVKTVEGSAHNPVANITFELNGEKKIMLNYAKLRILS
jgi:DNA helicase II / ATP-dependent DNA helicase PcrA